MLDIIDTGLERRNYLMHNFFRTHNFAMFDETGRQAMLEELKNIQEHLISRMVYWTRCRRCSWLLREKTSVGAVQTEVEGIGARALSAEKKASVVLTAPQTAGPGAQFWTRDLQHAKPFQR